MCQVEVAAEGAETFTLICSPACLSRVIERYLANPDVAEQFLEELTYEGGAVGRGGAKDGSVVGQFVIEDKEKKLAFGLGGDVHYADGQMQGSGHCTLIRRF